MRAYVTTIGEKTTDICIAQLRRFGFEVYVLDGPQPWLQKYKRFIRKAEGPCIRVDADVIVNKNIKDYSSIQTITDIRTGIQFLMAQFKVFDFYKNDVHIGQPIWYSAEALKIITQNIDRLDPLRPETSAWRFKEINNRTGTMDEIVGMHGFFQDDAHFSRSLQHRTDRRQLSDSDYDLARELRKL